MSCIILIETSTSLCSTALLRDEAVISYKESDKRDHASKTALFIKEMLDEQGISAKDCSAVCVSQGPGSYTGLRVGVSTAKGLCFGAGIPLISVGSLDTLVWQAIGQKLLPEGCKHIIPMIDARRMEVYTAVFDSEGKQLSQTRPLIVEENSFAKELDEGPVLFIGDGAGKCQSLISHPNASFIQCSPRAADMLIPALEEYKEKRFKDLAYFEPFYLKEFIATVSKKCIF